MNSNYAWQKHQAHSRIQGRLSEAKSHRLARQGSTRKSFKPFVLLKKVFGKIKQMKPQAPSLHIPEKQQTW